MERSFDIQELTEVKKGFTADENNWKPSEKINVEFDFKNTPFADDAKFINPSLDYQIPTGIETWEKQIRLHAKIYQLDKNAVYCDCLMNEEDGVFEKREFPRYLFDGINDLNVGKFAFITIRTAKGKMRVDVKDGKGVVNPKKFELNLDWDKFQSF